MSNLCNVAKAGIVPNDMENVIIIRNFPDMPNIELCSIF